jgi:hypothetical protein
VGFRISDIEAVMDNGGFRQRGGWQTGRVFRLQDDRMTKQQALAS